MEATYEITPEMLGLDWRRVIHLALAKTLVVTLCGSLLSFLFHRQALSGGVLGLVFSALLVAFQMRALSRTKLRLTDESIEELDGPIIRKGEIASVNEYDASSADKYPGIEIIGASKPRWLRKYEIFVPAALPQYEEIRQTIRGWTGVQPWHRA